VICAAKAYCRRPADERESVGRLDRAVSKGPIRRRSLPPASTGGRCAAETPRQSAGRPMP
jgi:hypothetical protein